MDKKELTQAIFKRTGLTQEQAKTAVDALFDIMKENLQARTAVSIRGFGTFEPIFPTTKIVQVPTGQGISPLLQSVNVKFGPSADLIQSMRGPHGPGGGEDD